MYVLIDWELVGTSATLEAIGSSVSDTDKEVVSTC